MRKKGSYHKNRPFRLLVVAALRFVQFYLNDIAHTVDTANTHGIVLRGGRVRRLMPRECFRLQGFSEDQIDKILAINSDAQA